MTTRIRLPRREPRPPSPPPAACPPPRTWAELTERLMTLRGIDPDLHREAAEDAIGWAACDGPDVDFANFPPEAVAACWEGVILPEYGHLFYHHPF